MKNRKLRSPILGYILFFLTIAVTVTIAMLVYGAVNSRYNGNRPIIALVLLVVILFLAAACSLIDLLRRKIMVDKPLKELLEATDSIASGDFNVILPITHKPGLYDEFDLLKENVNVMVSELRKSETLNSDFARNLSHEIKTPLSVIQSHATALSGDKLREDKRRESIAALLSAVRRITVLVGDILQLNRLENGGVQPQAEEVNLSEILANSILSYENELDSKNITLDCQMDDIITKNIQSYLEIVCNNLISNAVKFTGENGKISVILARMNGEITLSVTDDGIGMTAEQGKRIFDKFYQADESRAGQGNGLGLALVKKVITLMGGDIFVRSELGKGSTFTVKIHEVK